MTAITHDQSLDQRSQPQVAPIIDTAARQAEAARFLTVLDEDAAVFCFQTFDDSPQKRKTLARTIHGALPKLWRTLDAMNQVGAGIFVAVNQVEAGQPRGAAHVCRVRAVFADFDPPKTQGPPSRYPLPTVMEVQTSPHRCHSYWTCDDLPLNDFTPIQRAIVAVLGSDPAPVDLPRVMRLPGFYHRKDPDHPFLVRLAVLDERLPYSAEALRQAFPPVERTQGGATSPAAPGVVLTPAQVGALRSALLAMRADDRGLWVKIGLALKHLGDPGRALWLEWSATSPKFDPAVAAETWDSLKPERTDYRAVFAEAGRQGWVNPARRDAAPERSEPPDCRPVGRHALRAAPKDDGGWPDPEPLRKQGEMADPAPFPLHQLPSEVQNAVTEVARFFKVPPVSPALVALSVIATAIGKRAVVAERPGLNHYPALFFAGVAATGERKTPVFRAMTQPLEDWTITVGRPVTWPPPYRSRRAELPHRALRSYSLRTWRHRLILRSCGRRVDVGA